MAHAFDPLMARCTRCLTDEQYFVRHQNVPCLEQMRERNRRRIANVLYGEAEKMRAGADRVDLFRFMRGELTDTEYDTRRVSRRYAGQRAAIAFLRDTPSHPGVSLTAEEVE